MAISKHTTPYSTAVAGNTTAGIRNYSKYERSPANMQQNDGRPGVGNYVGVIPADAVLAQGDIIVCSDIQNAGMSILGFHYSVEKTLGTGVKLRPAIFRYPDPAATSAIRANAADKSVLQWLDAEFAGQAAKTDALSATQQVATAIDSDIETAETSGAIPLVGYPQPCNFFMGFAVTAAHSGATPKVPAAVEFHAHYQYAIQTQREV